MLFIVSFSILYGLIPFLFFLFIKNKISKEIKAIIPFLLLVFIASIYEFVFTILMKWNASNWFITYCLISFFVIFYFYFKILIKVNRSIKVLSFLLFLLMLLFLNIKYSSQDFLLICSFIDTYITIFIFVFSLIWFRKTFRDLEYESLLNIPDFYFISGFILYYFGNFFLFIMTELIYKSNQDLLQYYWLLNLFLLIVIRTLLIVGIWKARVK